MCSATALGRYMALWFSVWKMGSVILRVSVSVGMNTVEYSVLLKTGFSFIFSK